MIDHGKLTALADQIGLSAETAQANSGSVNWRTLRRYEEALRAIASPAPAPQHPPAEPAARAEAAVGNWADDDFYARHPLPVLHDDPATNAEILIQALCDRLDTTRRALADAAAMQVVQPTLSQIKANAAWAMNETDPRRLLPRSVSYTLVEAQEKSDPSPAHAGAGDAEALAKEVWTALDKESCPGVYMQIAYETIFRRLAGGDHGQ